MQLHHHPFCPHSRFVRLVFGEYGMEPTLVEERVWERRPDFLALDPAGATPVVVEEHGLAVPGAAIIAEYLDETRGLALGDRRLLPEDPRGRIEG
jgi:glutathione S-transferase